MLFRKKSETEAAPDQPSAASSDTSAGKGRPTPTRREAEAARKERVKPTLDKREARKRDRAALRADRDASYRAMQSGDESHFPARDRGKVRRYVRDMVDGRRLFTEFFLPVMIVILLLALLPITGLAEFITLFWLVALALVISELSWVGFRLRRGIRERFPDDPGKGHILYGVMRATQLRRLRLPKPVVKPGQEPRP